jgi:hypothetical protein
MTNRTNGRASPAMRQPEQVENPQGRTSTDVRSGAHEAPDPVLGQPREGDDPGDVQTAVGQPDPRRGLTRGGEISPCHFTPGIARRCGRMANFRHTTDSVIWPPSDPGMPCLRLSKSAAHTPPGSWQGRREETSASRLRRAARAPLADPTLTPPEGLIDHVQRRVTDSGWPRLF